MHHQDKVLLESLLARLSVAERRQLQRRALVERQRLQRRPASGRRQRGAGDGDDDGWSSQGDCDTGDDASGWRNNGRRRERGRPAPSVDDVLLDLLRARVAGVVAANAETPRSPGAGGVAVPESAPVTAAPVASTRASAIVVGVGPGTCRVRCGDTTGLHPLHPDLARVQKTAVAVGDFVRLEGGRVVAVEPRRSSLSRPDPQVPGVGRVIAANIDVAVIVVTLSEPPLRPGLIDRMLVAIGRGGVTPLIAVNKMDLVPPGPERDALWAGVAPYVELGVPVLAVAAQSGEGIAALRARLAGKTCVLMGHSGVGKSSLVNALAPELGIKTNGLRRSDLKGRHTTTASALHELADGIVVIDTPGVREFGLAQAGPSELAAHFGEFAAFSGRCRFGDCRHRQEPGCAVRAAAVAGDIPAARYRSYRRLLGDSGELVDDERDQRVG